MKILVTHPGKFVDLIYTLPAVIELQKLFDCDVHFQTSKDCQPLIELLESQPYIKKAFVNEDYRLERFSYGCQPWKMPEPPGYAKIYHLGIRPDQNVRHLIEAPFEILKKEYGINLSLNKDVKYLFLKKKFNYNYVVFYIFDESLVPVNQHTQDALSELWENVFKSLDVKFVIVSGPEEKYKCEQFKGVRIICSSSLLEAAQLINDCACFVGIQSALAAIANGLKVPRVILHWYENAAPTGNNCEHFGIMDPISDILDKLRKFIKLKSKMRILKGLGKERVVFNNL